MEEKTDNYYVGVRFAGADKTYYYSTKFLDLKLGDTVIVDSDGAVEAAVVSTTIKNTATQNTGLELKPVLRKASYEDLRIVSRNETKAKILMEVAQNEASAKELPMDFVAAYLSFNGDVITLVYTSTEKRVDFRELLPILGARLKARVSLRQIASRDRAKMIGGIGICGLPLCCSTFLTTFESISISKMKNQMLAINIPKYSGPCEKLMCCLAYEDELYAKEKTQFPHIGQEVKYNEEVYTVNSFNILSRTVRLANADHSDFQTFPLEDVLAMQNGTYVPRKDPLPSEKEYELPDYNLAPKQNEKQDRQKEQKQGKNDKNSGDSHRKDRNQPQNGVQEKRSDKEQGQQNQQRRQNDRNRNQNNRQDRRDSQRRRPEQRNPQENSGVQRQQSRRDNKEQRRQSQPGHNGDAANRVDANQNDGNKPHHNNRHHRYHGNRNRRGGGSGENE